MLGRPTDGHARLLSKSEEDLQSCCPTWRVAKLAMSSVVLRTSRRAGNGELGGTPAQVGNMQTSCRAVRTPKLGRTPAQAGNAQLHAAIVPESSLPTPHSPQPRAQTPPTCPLPTPRVRHYAWVARVHRPDSAPLPTSRLCPTELSSSASLLELLSSTASRELLANPCCRPPLRVTQSSRHAVAASHELIAGLSSYEHGSLTRVAVESR